MAFHPSHEGLLASGCLGGHVRIWDLKGGSEIWQTDTVINSLAFHPTERLLGAKYLIFFLLSFSQNERKIYQFCSVSFAQFVYFLREVCLLFNFIIQKLKSKHTSLKKYTN